MKKLKNCSVTLVGASENEVQGWIKEIEGVFSNVNASKIRACIFSTEGKDFRSKVEFQSNLSRVEIYRAMNKIKANPIKFS